MEIGNTIEKNNHLCTTGNSDTGWKNLLKKSEKKEDAKTSDL